ncbi:intradiol ring-cleavage dioxygenase [Novosphingobium subterraneum]|uniref:intradiol ring-cleavage dioxygenase n=1 Tax=Novosphingobium subterraneum TaxID=48936 RepID=UPI003D0605F3
MQHGDITEDTSHDHQSEGLAADLAQIERLRVGRRRALALFGSAGGSALLFGCGGSDGAASSTTTVTTSTATATATASATATATATATAGTCTVPATETNGPYPADGTNTASGITSNALTASGIVRSDIRSSFLGSSTATAVGVQLTLTLTVVDVNNGCAPLAGYAVYIWHCTADGYYSLYTLPNESYLRGVQVTDTNGQVTFTTIFPGCYSGRYPHIHFEVFSSLANATNANYARLISQLALPAAACNEVYALSAYPSSKTNFANVTLSSDNVFGDNTDAQLAVMTPTVTGSTTTGYTGTTTIGIAT